MSKIKTIKFQNFKAITGIEVDLKGCTAIVTAGNNKGKSSLLRGMPDAIRGIMPDVKVTKGATQGKGEMTLTSGERFTWDFTDTKSTLNYFSDKDLKTSVSRSLAERFFKKEMFDIDAFLQCTPKEQSKQLQKLIGIDFTAIDARYKEAYANRTDRNRDVANEAAKLDGLGIVAKVEAVSLTELQAKKEAIREKLNNLFLANKAENTTRRKAWNDLKTTIDNAAFAANQVKQNECDTKRAEAIAANDKARKDWKIAIENEDNAVKKSEVDFSEKSRNYQDCCSSVDILEKNGLNLNLSGWLLALKTDIGIIYKAQYPAEPVSRSETFTFEPTVSVYPPEPEYVDEMPDNAEIVAIDAEIVNASATNEKARLYTNYLAQIEAHKKAIESAKVADEAVKAIESEKAAMIAGAKMPAGIEITSEGILVDGFPLDRNQISTSKLYCAALRIAAMNLGEVRALHFDASFLDKNTLAEIQAWAVTQDLQLLIEQCDRQGGDIQYELIEEHSTEPVNETLFR